MKDISKRSQSRRARRGATILFVALFAVALVALAAFAIDVSRLYVGTNELQTGADASALRGALHMQYTAGADRNPTMAVMAFAPANEALSQPLEVANAAVRPVRWTPGSGADTVAATWATANAVQVTAERTTGLLFGKVLSAVAPSPKRRAIAWVANVNRINCPAPWAFPMSGLNSLLFGTGDHTTRENMFAELSARLQNPGPLSVTMIFYPSSEPPPPPAGSSWPFQAFGDKPDMNSYADQLADASRCSAIPGVGVDAVETFPGQGGGAVPQKTVSGAFGAGITGGASLCEPKSAGGNAASAADCYPVGSGRIGPAGVTVVTSFIGPVTGSSARVVSLGGFRVMCVFTGKPGGKKNEINNDPSESCDWYKAYRTSPYAPAGLPVSLGQGTIVGYPIPMFVRFEDGVDLGTAPSLAQRLILVR